MLNDVETNGHLFCAAIQFKTWYELLVREEKDVVKQEDVLQGDVTRGWTPTFSKCKRNLSATYELRGSVRVSQNEAFTLHICCLMRD